MRKIKLEGLLTGVTEYIVQRQGHPNIKLTDEGFANNHPTLKFVYERTDLDDHLGMIDPFISLDPNSSDLVVRHEYQQLVQDTIMKLRNGQDGQNTFRSTVLSKRQKASALLLASITAQRLAERNK